MQIDGSPFSSGMTTYKNQADFGLTVTTANDNDGSLFVVNLDDGSGAPGDLALLFLTAGANTDTVTIPNAVSPATYSGTFTFYDIGGNPVSDTFTFVYDTDPPAAPAT